MNALSAAIQRKREQAGGDIGTLTVSQIDNVFSWAGALEGPALARLLIGQIASDGSDDLLKRCTAAILATDIAEALLAELVTLVPVSRASLTVVANIVRALRSGHPLAQHDLSSTTPFAVYDALDDGKELFVSSARIERQRAIGTSGLLLGVEVPLEQITPFRIVRHEADGTYFKIDADTPWLERGHVVCPPFIVIY